MRSGRRHFFHRPTTTTTRSKPTRAPSPVRSRGSQPETSPRPPRAVAEARAVAEQQREKATRPAPSFSPLTAPQPRWPGAFRRAARRVARACVLLTSWQRLGLGSGVRQAGAFFFLKHQRVAGCVDEKEGLQLVGKEWTQQDKESCGFSRWEGSWCMGCRTC